MWACAPGRARNVRFGLLIFTACEYSPSARKTLSPAAAWLIACWMVANGAASVPALLSSPSGATCQSAACGGVAAASMNVSRIWFFIVSTSVYPCVVSANADQRPPGVPAFEQGLEGFRQALERQFLGQGEVELLREK